VRKKKDLLTPDQNVLSRFTTSGWCWNGIVGFVILQLLLSPSTTTRSFPFEKTAGEEGEF